MTGGNKTAIGVGNVGDESAASVNSISQIKRHESSQMNNGPAEYDLRMKS